MNSPNHREQQGRGLEGWRNETSNSWKLKSQTLFFGRLPALMGIVNVTPDSFSDGGKYDCADAALDHAMMLDSQGATILDVGGESTRPYSDPVSEQEELDRVLPVIERICKETQTPVSVDTTKAAVAGAAIAAGAEIINDISALQKDPEMVNVAIESGAGICAMHMQGSPQSMQDNPQYECVTQDVFQLLQQRDKALIEAGVDPDRICLDPGIGFGKTLEHNLQLIRDAKEFHKLKRPILIGHSRKGFIGEIIGDKTATRTYGTLAITLQLATAGVQVIRLHEIEPAIHALAALNATGGIDGS